MKSKVHLFPDTTSIQPREVAALAAELGRPMSDEEVRRIALHGLAIENEEAVADAILGRLQSLGIRVTVRRETLYTREEILRATLAFLSITSAPRGIAGPGLDTEYDSQHACPRCGTGAVQVSPLRVNARDVPRSGDVAQTLSDERLMSARLRSFVTSEFPAVAADLRQVETPRQHTALPWWQLAPHRTLPPMGPTSEGIVRSDGCSLCSRDGFFHALAEPFNPAYDAGLLADLVHDRDGRLIPAFWNSYEYFGISRRGSGTGGRDLLAKPLVFVTRPIVVALLMHRVGRIRFTPVTLV